MSTNTEWMIYGANGYTGELMAREAESRGWKPVLAGRNAAAIEKLATELHCPHRVFDLDGSPDDVASHLEGIRAVIHCAGPFSKTSLPMLEGCLKSGTHYLDITGEMEVIQTCAAQSDRGRTAGITIMPAVGFDVVPTDCMAASLAAELPTATKLELAFAAISEMSRGTAKTMIENLPSGGRARIDGEIVPVPNAWKTMQVPFRNGPKFAMTIPWGDLATAYYSTGIPNIETYMAVPPKQASLAKNFGWLFRLAGFAPIQRLLVGWIEKNRTGPDEESRKRGSSSIWGRVSDDAGHSVEGTLETPEGYTLTVDTALASVERVLQGHTHPGYATPSMAFGKDFILSVPGTDMQLGTPSIAKPA